jgi:hypothetical protein
VPYRRTYPHLASAWRAVSIWQPDQSALGDDEADAEVGLDAADEVLDDEDDEDPDDVDPEDGVESDEDEDEDEDENGENGENGDDEEDDS